MLNKIATRQVPWHAGMTELNHLGSALMIKPHLFESKMDKLFSSKDYYSDNPLTSITTELGADLEISSNEWEYKMEGACSRPFVVKKNIDPSNKTAGRGRETFKLCLDENWGEPGDVLSPGTSGQLYQSRIQEKLQRHGGEGGGYVYVMRLVSDDPTAFVPAQYLNAGQPWAKLYSTYGEADIQDGSTIFSSPIYLRGSLGKFRKKYSVTDYAAEQVLQMGYKDADGKSTTKWMALSESVFWKQMYKEREQGLFYNRLATSVESATGRKVDSFAGILQQLEDSERHYYTQLTANLIETFLLDIFFGRVKPGPGRKVKVFTGEYGMFEFSRAMQEGVDKKGWVIANQNFSPIEKVSSQYHSNAYSVGYQFVKYKMGNGIELEVIHNPIYDDRSIHFEIDPITGYPVESMRYTFLDFSNEGGSNIQIVKKKDGYKFGYVNGLVSPYGPNKGGSMSHAGEYYSMHVSTQIGVKIHDVTRCGEMILQRHVGL